MKSLRVLLRKRLEWVEDRLMENADINGYGYISPSMARLYSYIDHQPTPMSDLARKLKISRQAVHQLVGEGIESGFLQLTNASSNKKIKMVQFSEAGQAMAKVALAEIEKAENKLKLSLGEDNVRELRRILELDWPED